MATRIPCGVVDSKGCVPEVGDVIRLVHYVKGKRGYDYKVVGVEYGRLVAWDATELVTDPGHGHRCSLEFCGKFEIVSRKRSQSNG